MNSNIDPYWNRLVSTGLRFLQEQGNIEAVTIIKNAILNVEFNGHDNWNGGINFWDLVFQLRYRDYIAIAAKKEKIEGEILKILEAFHTDGRNCLANVIIRPKIEQYIDWNAIFPATKESTHQSNNERTEDAFRCGYREDIFQRGWHRRYVPREN